MRGGTPFGPRRCPRYWLLARDLTDANAALFDARNAFAGCIAGIHRGPAATGIAGRDLVPGPGRTVVTRAVARDRSGARVVSRISRTTP